MKKIIGLSAFLATQVFGQAVYVPKAETLNAEGSEFNMQLEYFAPTSVVTEAGEAQALTENNKVIFTNVDASFRYGITPNLELFAGASFQAVNSILTIESGDNAGDYSLSNSSFESAYAGFKFGSQEIDQVKYAFEGYYKQKMFSNTDLTTEQAYEITNLGDDTREYAIGGGAHIRTLAGNFYEFRALYRSPAEYLSTEIFSEAQLGLVWNSVAIYGGVENVYSLENSPYSSDDSDQPNYDIVNSKLYNSINRSWTAPYMGMNIALGKTWRLGGRYTLAYTGNSTDLGPRILISLTKRVEVEKEYRNRDKQFKEYRHEGTVQKISKSKKLAVIDLGLKNEITKGMVIDFYYFDYVGGNELIARGVVLKVQSAKAVVRIKKRYGKRRVQEGTVIRAGQLE